MKLAIKQNSNTIVTHTPHTLGEDLARVLSKWNENHILLSLATQPCKAYVTCGTLMCKEVRSGLCVKGLS